MSRSDTPNAPLLTADESFMRRALNLAREAEALGEVPVGALVVLNGDVVGEGYNCPITSNDPTAHAEVRALRAAAQAVGNYRLPGSTLYVTLEPCAMCAGAIHWGNVRRVVFALSEVALYEIIGPSPEHLLLPCRDVFAHSQRQVEVEGPAMELDVEARAVHAGFWKP